MIWIMALIMISWIIIMISDVDTSSVVCFLFFVFTSVFVLFMAISIPVGYFGSIGRIAEMQALFAYSCGVKEPISTNTQAIIDNLTEIDKLISDNAPKWPLDKINKIDLAVMRQALWEIYFQKTNPPKVVIDEAIEIAKEFGTETSSSFVNGVIGSIIKNVPIQKS